MAVWGTIDVELEPEAALEIVEATFAAAGGWVLARGDDGLRIRRADPRQYVFDPDPGPRAIILPETLGLRVQALALAGGGARVCAWVEHRRRAMVVAVMFELLTTYGFGSLLHAVQMLALRRNRRGGKRRMLRLVIEPLLPHERAGDPGPFRRGR